jgi:hypothetical protein
MGKEITDVERSDFNFWEEKNLLYFNIKFRERFERNILIRKLILKSLRGIKA